MGLGARVRLESNDAALDARCRAVLSRSAVSSRRFAASLRQLACRKVRTNPFSLPEARSGNILQAPEPLPSFAALTLPEAYCRRPFAGGLLPKRSVGRHFARWLAPAAILASSEYLVSNLPCRRLDRRRPTANGHLSEAYCRSGSVGLRVIHRRGTS